MSSFDHYPDMDHDGDHDLKDSGLFHEMMDEGSSPRVEGWGESNSIEILSGILFVIGFFVLLALLFS